MAGPGAGGVPTSSAVLSDVLALSAGAGSTWGQLPPAGALEIADDMVGPQGWLVLVEGLGVAGLPDALRQLALASTDEGFVTPPLELSELTARVGLIDRAMAAYPILAEAS
jgi:hypothetical protein